MESLDLASEVTTEEVYCWKNNKKKIFRFLKNKSQKFIAVIDFGVKNKILSLFGKHWVYDSCVSLHFFF